MQTLNSEQKKAVSIKNGKSLVLAGAGSGKTKVITFRIANLIQKHKIAPENILGLTFTNKAAKEMKERLQSLIGSKAKKVKLTTFHSFCMYVLRKEAKTVGYSSNFSIYDETDMQRLIKELSKNILKEEKNLPPLTSFVEAISSAKNNDTPIDEIPSLGDKDKDKFLKELYIRLHSSLKAYNAVDFDSLLTLTKKLFEQNIDILSKYQDQFKYILIDEYQDTNPVQDSIANLLALKHNNLFVVGDDDQSIYGWRGSNIQNILSFKADHIIKLEKNYRSTKTILHAANNIIKNNKMRHNKTLFSDMDINENIKLFHAPSEVEEAQSVVNRIIKIKTEKNLRWKDIAILYRSNALSRNFEMSLMSAMWKNHNSWKRGVPYDISGGLEFNQRSEIKDILAYLKIICNPKDQEALLRIINVPRRGISDKTLEIVTNLAKKNKSTIWQILEKIAFDKIDLSQENIKSKTIYGIKQLVEIINTSKIHFKQRPLYKSLKWLLDKINYKKAIEEEVKSEKARQVKLENAMECINAISIYEEQTDKKEVSLNHFISTTMLSKENLHKKNGLNNDAVQLMTFHSAKGLEFEACFLIGLEDHIIPHEKSMLTTSLDEERRLMYVAITRAKKYLTLSMARQRKNKGKARPTNPSRFLFEIPKELMDVVAWKSI